MARATAPAAGPQAQGPEAGWRVGKSPVSRAAVRARQLAEAAELEPIQASAKAWRQEWEMASKKPEHRQVADPACQADSEVEQVEREGLGS